jgi:hypothetical protein
LITTSLLSGLILALALISFPLTITTVLSSALLCGLLLPLTFCASSTSRFPLGALIFKIL